MITIKISNTPANAAYWLPIIRVGGPNGAIYMPPNNILLSQSWQSDQYGDVEFRADILDYSMSLIEGTFFTPVVFNSGTTYTFNWATKTLESGDGNTGVMKWLLGGAGIVLLAFILTRGLRR